MATKATGLLSTADTDTSLQSANDKNFAFNGDRLSSVAQDAKEAASVAAKAAALGKFAGAVSNSPDTVKAFGTLGMAANAVNDPVGFGAGMAVSKLGASAPVAGALLGGLSSARAGESTNNVAASAIGGATSALASKALFGINPAVAFADLALSAFGLPSVSGAISNGVQNYKVAQSVDPELGPIDSLKLGYSINNDPDPLGAFIASKEGTATAVDTGAEDAAAAGIATQKAADTEAGSGWGGTSGSDGGNGIGGRNMASGTSAGGSDPG